jgi:ATP-dependent Lon protease
MNIQNGSSQQSKYPIVAVREGSVFPSTENVLLFGRDKSVLAVNESIKRDSRIVILMQKNGQVNDPLAEDLYSIGVLARVEKIIKGEKGEISALVKGEKRAKIIEFTQSEPFFEATIEELAENITESDENQALVKHITNELKKAVNLGKGIDFIFLMNIMSGVATGDFADQIAMILDIKPHERQGLLEELNLSLRLKKESEYITNEVRVLELERNISVKTQQKFEKGMKDAVLREKLKTIEQELGGDSKEDKDIKELRTKILKAQMPKAAEEKALKELKRLAQMSQYNPEVSYIRTYLEWLIDLPWSVQADNNVDIKMAESILDEDHFGLKKIKERILEYLAVMKLKQATLSEEEKDNQKTDIDQEEEALKLKKSKQPTILCFVGPPGVGKTSIGRSIARALGRKFVKISLGGIKDEAEIRGHRRTYVGAMPGRIIQGIKQAGTKNPVFMLDEIDKIGRDYRGDPSSALLEALDPEQNYAFSDHYLEADFDLSDVMFVTTANMLDTIPEALLDRLEVIHFPGYTEDEKYNILKNYLLKKQLEVHGLANKDVKVEEDALRLIIRRYTREAGVRELERQIAAVFRKVAREFVENNITDKDVDEKQLLKYLGPFKYSSQMIEEKNTIGIVTGLAWTQAGGDILFIEVSVMPGRGNLTLTGHLGDVMKESCQAALSYVRSRYEMFGLEKDFYHKLDIHVHVPEGAVPKDGPSAGTAIATAMVSALTKIPIKKEVGMTGEITLRGRVMEIGGIKEKTIAAHRAGIKTIVMPKENMKDIEEDVPKHVLTDLKFVPVTQVDEALAEALDFPGKKMEFKSKITKTSK